MHRPGVNLDVGNRGMSDGLWVGRSAMQGWRIADVSSQMTCKL